MILIQRPQASGIVGLREDDAGVMHVIKRLSQPLMKGDFVAVIDARKSDPVRRKRVGVNVDDGVNVAAVLQLNQALVNVLAFEAQMCETLAAVVVSGRIRSRNDFDNGLVAKLMALSKEQRKRFLRGIAEKARVQSGEFTLRETNADGHG